ncbi:hypothetical protein D9M72_572200 [compost metagenome]
MLQAHDHAVCRLGCDLEDVRDGFADSGQGVIPRGSNRGGKSREDAGSFMFNKGRFAVHQLRRVRHRGSVGLGQCLVSQADAEHRLVVAAAPFDQVNADPGLRRGAGTRRDEDAVARVRHLDCLSKGDVVVSDHRCFGAELLEVAHQGVNKAVVVVYDQDLGGAHCRVTKPIVESVNWVNCDIQGKRN